MPPLAFRTVLLAALVPLSTMGQDVPISEPRTASKAEYLSCLVDRALIDKRTRALQEQDKALKELSVKFQAAEADLAEQVKRNPPRTKKAIDSYNRAVSARNSSAERFNERGKSIQREQEGLNGFIVDSNIRCGRLLVSVEVAAEAEQEFQSLPRAK